MQDPASSGCSRPSWQRRRVLSVGHDERDLGRRGADYFGDGRSFTVDGALLNLYDGLGIQEDTEAWSFEAEWGPEGARCVSCLGYMGGWRYWPKRGACCHSAR